LQFEKFENLESASVHYYVYTFLGIDKSIIKPFDHGKAKTW